MTVLISALGGLSQTLFCIGQVSQNIKSEFLVSPCEIATRSRNEQTNAEMEKVALATFTTIPEILYSGPYITKNSRIIVILNKPK